MRSSFARRRYRRALRLAVLALAICGLVSACWNDDCGDANKLLQQGEQAIRAVIGQARCVQDDDCRYVALYGHCHGVYVVYSASDVDSVQLARLVAYHQARIRKAIDGCKEPCPRAPAPPPPEPGCVGGNCADTLGLWP
jgi:hypothetical protein